MEGSHREQISLVESLPAPPLGVVFLLARGILLDSLLAELSRIGAHVLAQQFTLDQRALKTLFQPCFSGWYHGCSWKRACGNRRLELLLEPTCRQS